MKSAATGQLELVPTPRCDFCGPLPWTKERWGQLLHKCGCPHRTEKFCQAHPTGCDDFTDVRKGAYAKNYQMTELQGTTWTDVFGGAA